MDGNPSMYATGLTCFLILIIPVNQGFQNGSFILTSDLVVVEDVDGEDNQLLSLNSVLQADMCHLSCLFTPPHLLINCWDIRWLSRPRKV